MSHAAGTASSRPAAVYERELDASVERIWENVLDWEHLPYLHAQAFSSVRMTSSSRDHWCGEVGLAGSGGIVDLDVRLDRANLRYVSSTVSGPGAGSDIVTQMFPRSERRTGIRVEFLLPWVADGAESAIGEIYRNLYVGLWDQDEAMMVERQRVLDGTRSSADAPRSVVLGRVREMASKLPMDVELGGRSFRVVSIDGRMHAYDTRCPHLGGPLGAAAVEGCEIACPWHGYRFDVKTGLSSDGRRYRMAPPAVIEVDACGGEVSLRLP